LLHQVGDLFELNVKLRCQKVKVISMSYHVSAILYSLTTENGGNIYVQDHNREQGTSRLFLSSLWYGYPLTDSGDGQTYCVRLQHTEELRGSLWFHIWNGSIYTSVRLYFLF